MKSNNILIVEDNALIAENHKETLQDFGLDNILIAHTKEEAIVFLEEHKIDLVLLDVRLDTGFEGIDLGGVIADKYSIPFIYLTAHSDLETVKKIVATNPVSYLSKPIRKSDLYAAVSIVFQESEENKDDWVALPNGKSIFRYAKSDFILAQSSGNYVNIKLNNDKKSRLIRLTLTALEEKLANHGFIRVNRFFIVNTDYITSLEMKCITIDGEKISISKEKYQELKELLSKK